MGRSWSVGTYFDIPVKIHWSFGFILIYLGYIGTSEGLSISQLLFIVFLSFSVFFCVILHEYGHALMARRFKVNTKDIILFPIGGVARLERIPTIPRQELLIAIAGPLVNVVIFILGMLVLLLYYEVQFTLEWFNDVSGSGVKNYLIAIIFVNALLFLFNLIPAFPMDGGRILRALLSYKFGLGRATQIATHIARVFAVGFVLYGLYDFHPIQIAIGIFVFIASGSENNHTQFNLKIQNTTLGQLELKAATVMLPTEPMSRLFELYHTGVAKNFLVCDHNNQLIGTVPEIFIKRYLENEQLLADDQINQRMSKRFLILSQATSLLEAAQAMNKTGVAIAAVRDDSDSSWYGVDRKLLAQFAEQ